MDASTREPVPPPLPPEGASPAHVDARGPKEDGHIVSHGQKQSESSAMRRHEQGLLRPMQTHSAAARHSRSMKPADKGDAVGSGVHGDRYNAHLTWRPFDAAMHTQPDGPLEAHGAQAVSPAPLYAAKQYQYAGHPSGLLPSSQWQYGGPSRRGSTGEFSASAEVMPSTYGHDTQGAIPPTYSPGDHMPYLYGRSHVHSPYSHGGPFSQGSMGGVLPSSAPYYLRDAGAGVVPGALRGGLPPPTSALMGSGAGSSMHRDPGVGLVDSIHLHEAYADALARLENASMYAAQLEDQIDMLAQCMSNCKCGAANGRRLAVGDGPDRGYARTMPPDYVNMNWPQHHAHHIPPPPSSYGGGASHVGHAVHAHSEKHGDHGGLPLPAAHVTHHHVSAAATAAPLLPVAAADIPPDSARARVVAARGDGQAAPASTPSAVPAAAAVAGVATTTAIPPAPQSASQQSVPLAATARDAPALERQERDRRGRPLLPLSAALAGGVMAIGDIRTGLITLPRSKRYRRTFAELDQSHMRRFRCTVGTCGRMYALENSLKQHMKNKHNIATDDTPFGTRPLSSDKASASALSSPDGLTSVEDCAAGTAGHMKNASAGPGRRRGAMPAADADPSESADSSCDGSGETADERLRASKRARVSSPILKK